MAKYSTGTLIHYNMFLKDHSNTPRLSMVKISDLLVDKSLHGLGTDRRGVIPSPV